MAGVVLKDLVKVYERHIAVRGIDLEIPDKALAVFVGPIGLRQVDDAADDRRAGDHLARRPAGRRRAWSTTCPRATAASPWCSSPTRSTRT